MLDPRYTTRPPVVHQPADDDAWFAPKRYGYGSGLPIRWQGWALLASYIALLGGLKLLMDRDDGVSRGLSFGLFVAATAVLAVVSARRTRGGWKWRWGTSD